MVDRAIKIAKRSSHKRFLTGAVIAYKNVVYSEGWSHTSNLRLTQLYSMHAEIHALGRGRHNNLGGATCYIATISGKSGNITTAKPCLTCAIALRAAGINKVIYTVPNGETATMDLDEDLSDLKVYTRRII